MRFLFLAIVFALAPVTSEAGIWNCFGGLWAYLAGGPKIVAPLPPGAAPLLLRRDEAPPTPTAMMFEVISVTEDQDFPGTYLYKVKPRMALRPSFESGSFVDFVTKHPAFPAKLGIRLEKDGSFVYPDVSGINARIKKLQEAKDPEAPNLFLWEDAAPKGATQLAIAREWIEYRVPQSLNGTDGLGRSLHFHDLMVHNLAFLLLPKSVVEAQRSRLSLLVALKDDPALSQNEKFQGEVDKWIDKEVGDRLEFGSATVLRHLLATPGKDRTSNIQIGTSLLSLGDQHLARAIEEESNPAYQLTGRQRRALDRILAGAERPAETGVRAGAELENRFP